MTAFADERHRAAVNKVRRAFVPEPYRGGTWLYCPYRLTEKTAHGVSVTTCAGGPVELMDGSSPPRFRSGKAYRRHWYTEHTVIPWGFPMESTDLLVPPAHMGRMGLAPDHVFADEMARLAPDYVVPPTLDELRAEDLRDEVNAGVRVRLGVASDEERTAADQKLRRARRHGH